MKAAIYLGQKHIALEERPIPAVGPHDVLLQNLTSSICGTDVAVYNHGPNTGHRITIGGEFGHETVSRIAAVGEAVTEFSVGQRVYPYPRYATGDTRRAGTIGGFSEYIRVPNAKKNHSLYLVPDEIDTPTASLIEPFTVGCRAARRSMPAPGENAVVFGAGTIGIAAAIALQWFGVSRVMVCDISDFRLALAAKLGFAVCHPADFREQATAYFGTAAGLTGPTADVSIFLDAAGDASILDLYMETGKIESRFVSVAVNNAIRHIDLLHLTFAQKSIIGSGGYMPQDVHDVLAIMQSGRWDIRSIITHTFPLAQIERALQTASDPDHAGNVIIDFSL